jgi:[ribosomal protein S5]-alanine N-acetyltransferase
VNDIVLETERLILRPLVVDDLDALARLYADPEVRRFFPEGTLTREETLEELEWIIDVYYARYGYGLWATVSKETGAFIGRCGLLPWKIVPGKDGRPGLDGADEFSDDDSRVEVEVAYLLSREYWGRGLATEAARAIVALAFGQLHLDRLICLFEPENHASRKVAEHVGFTYEGDIEIDGEVLPLHSLRAPRIPVTP